jgi:membrane-bound PQQ-dependent dehydrogenase (glucose/quinate/shikimate family)
VHPVLDVSKKDLLEDMSGLPARHRIANSEYMTDHRSTTARKLSAVLIVLLISCNGWTQEWRSYGGDSGGTRFSPLRQINRQNVSALKRTWAYHTGEVDRQNETDRHQIAPFETTPIVVNGMLFLTTPSNRVIALDSESGKEIWQFDPQAGNPKRKFFQHRGVAYWQSETGDDRRILYGTFNGRLICLNAKNGKTCHGFGKDGVVNLRAGVADEFPQAEYAVTSAPAIFNDLVITGAAVPEYPSRGPSGAVRAYNVRTGELVWTFHTIPGPREAGHDTWAEDAWKNRTGVNVWSTMSVDVKHDLVFLPIGSPSYDFYGGDRKGQDLFANSLVALQASTGKLVWYFQMVHHDIWDYDPPAQPALITARQNGKAIPAVAEVTKMGFVFIFDRLTGKPLFPIEERAVPQSDVPGEAAWPTQPFPTKPPPLVRQSFTEADIANATPESHAYCADLFHSLTSRGMYTPYGLKQTLVVPGTLGGATWSGGSFDPTLGYLFVNVNELGSVGAMEPQPAGSPVPYRRGAAGGEYARFWDQNQRPCQNSPWGTLNAIDVNTGNIIWKTPLGQGSGIQGKTGSPNLGGSVVTAGGLLFIGATTDSRFRAFDSRSGKQLWVAELAASAHAAPVTYLGKKSRKQFVVVAAGGGGFFKGTTADEVVAFALPK